LRRSTFLAAAATLFALGAIGCTQDFNQFAPEGSASTGTTTTTPTGMGGAGGDGGSTTTTTTTTTNTGSEDCLNGIDDDSDGDVDCADSDCGGFGCVDPGNWEGPGILYDGAAAMVPGCPPDFPDVVFEGFGNPVQQAASCAPCACGAPTVTCTPANLTAFGNDNCSGGSDALVQPTANNTCQAVAPSGGTDSYRAAAPTVSATPCAASGGAPTVPPAQAGSLGRLCSATLSDAGCDAQGEVCAPNAVAAPFEAKVCVWRLGEQNCPAGYPDEHVFSNTLDDTRGCSACSCGDTVATCTATTTVYADGGCLTDIATVPNNNTCVTATAGASITTAKTTAGSCPASGGQPTGDVDLGPDRLTVCCMQ